MLLNKIPNNSIIICPGSIKRKILRQNKQLKSVTFMTKEEYKSHYFFSYTNKAIAYLMENYHYNLEVARMIIQQLYVIDTKKNYQEEKLRELASIKKDLIEQNYLIYDSLFKEYIKNKNLFVYGYYTLDQFEEEMFLNGTILKEKVGNISHTVTCCQTLEEEVVFVASEILKLYQKGIPLEKIFLANVGEEYFYSIHQVFSYFSIPITIDQKESIYGTNIVQEYIKSQKLPGFTNEIGKKLIEAVNSLVDVKDSKYYQQFLIDKLKNTYLAPKKYKNAVNVLSDLEIVDDDCYLFILGINQDVLPKIQKDEDYIYDSLKKEVSLYQTKEKNKLEKEYFKIIISNTKNVYLSYKKKSTFREYLKSSILTDLSLSEEEYILNYTNSSLYNKLLLGKMLDNYYKYHEVSLFLKPLFDFYPISYCTYQNTFTKIDSINYLNYIHHKLTLSYTSLNTYRLCPFRYYIKYILKLDVFKDNFNTLVGNLFHEMFSICYSDYFNFDKEWNRYMEKLEIGEKEFFFLELLKDTLKKDIEIIRNQDEYTKNGKKYFEKEITIPLNQPIPAVFTGKIDKIIYRENPHSTDVSVIDYKTGKAEGNLNNIKHGLNLQLPTYLFLIYYSNLFSNVKFSGMYLQKVLHSIPKYKKNFDFEKEYRDNLKLRGYSTSDKERLSLFDNTFETSYYIRGMRVKKDGEFYQSAKVLEDDNFEKIVEHTKKIITQTADSIIEGDFRVAPKIIEDENISCQYCSYKDLCFKTNKDSVILESQKDLSFLGGDTNG